jgi:hypothetical protein
MQDSQQVNGAPLYSVDNKAETSHEPGVIKFDLNGQAKDILYYPQSILNQKNNKQTLFYADKVC